MPGRTSAPYGNTTARRAVAAALIAAAALILAANAGPARAADPGPDADRTQQSAPAR
ncbi:hypothetical protein [Streptomyces sp. NPDC004546]|uniref:hypothetical protein n=1 Tax=unclassified Streptomyces TaxID=2593676 RepID=UPI0033BF4CE1